MNWSDFALLVSDFLGRYMSDDHTMPRNKKRIIASIEHCKRRNYTLLRVHMKDGKVFKIKIAED